MTLLRLLRQARQLYPLLSWYDLLIAGLEELLNQNKEPAIKWEDFWITKWANLDGSDYPPSLPAMYTVWHKGTPVMDTAKPSEWIQEQIDQARVT